MADRGRLCLHRCPHRQRDLATIVAGNTVGLVPFNALLSGTKFDVTRDLSVGVGILNYSHTFAASDNTVRLPGYTTDRSRLVLHTISEAVRAQINIENLFDRRYISTADNKTTTSRQRSAHDQGADHRSVLTEVVRNVSATGRPQLLMVRKVPSWQHCDVCCFRAINAQGRAIASRFL